MALRSTFVVADRTQSALLYEPAFRLRHPHFSCVDVTEAQVVDMAEAVFGLFPGRDFEECLVCVSEDWAPDADGIAAVWWLKPVLTTAFATLDSAQKEACLALWRASAPAFPAASMAPILEAVCGLAKQAVHPREDLVLHFE